MCRIYWKVVLICCVVRMIECGVKIEISRLKEPAKSVKIAPNDDIEKTTVSDAESTETTTIFTTPITETATTSTPMIVKPTISSNIQKLSNSTISSSSNTSEATTISPPNVTAPIKPAQPNTTTFVNNVTLSYAKDLNPYLSEFTRRQMRRKLIPQDYYCPCDLKINFCDINCCCDVDCATKEIIQTLKCADRDWSIHDYEESSELQLCSQQQQFSLFCVVDNTRKRKQSKKRDFLVQRVNIMSVVQYKWPNQYDPKSMSSSDYRENYVFGDSILAWDESNEEIHSLDVPWSFAASSCRIKTSTKHLVDDEIQCVQTMDEHDQFIADFQSNLKSVKILKSRKPIDTSPLIMVDFCKSALVSNETENCTAPDIYHCFEAITLRTCIQDINSTTTLPEFGENVIANELSIQIHHNFTHISNVTVFFVYHEMNTDAPMLHVVQKISLEYLEVNETFATRDVHQVSGNIGYLLHKPVIVSRIIRQNQSISENNEQIVSVLSYFHNETNCTNDGHYLKLPAIKENGDCLINNYTFQTVNFGERTRIKCNIILTPNELNDTDTNVHSMVNFEQNNTHICRAFQKQIFDYLLNDFQLEHVNSTIYNRFNIRISEMGNPKNDTEHWIDVITMRAPNLDDIVATGQTNGGTEFTCTNMILSIRYEFFYGTMLVGKISNQALIKLAQIQFGNKLNLKFKLDDDVLKVPVYIDVMFYDFSRYVGRGAHLKPHFICILFIAVFCSYLV